MPEQNSLNSTWSPLLESEKSKPDTNLLLHPATRYNLNVRPDSSRYTRPILRQRKLEEEPFLKTVEYNRFQEFCEACKEDRYLGLCLGNSGVGKTLSAHNYANWRFFSHFTNPHLERIPFDNVEKLPSFDTVVFTPFLSMSVDTVLVHLLCLMRAFESLIEKEAPSGAEGNEQVKLIIIDEANRLKHQSLEHIRDLSDQLRIGVVLMGLPGIEKYISCLPQFRNRVGFRHEFSPLCVADMMDLVESNGFNSLGLGISNNSFDCRDTLSLLVRSTGGNMRTLNRLCLQIKRILRINNFEKITRDVIEGARQSLILSE